VNVSGTLKTEKTLKIFEDEKRKEAPNLLDARQSVRMSDAISPQLKK
jgi:hypothetical protein